MKYPRTEAAKLYTSYYPYEGVVKVEDMMQLEDDLTEMTAYADKLAEGLPMLPKDIENIREANTALSVENAELKYILGQILSDLPQNRAWLDPQLERIGKNLVK